jgi:branched-chain amino acid transport system substrate-binding protein
MRLPRRIPFVVLCALLAVLGCRQDRELAEGRQVTSSARLKVGVVGPFDGPNAHIGAMIMNSVKLYFEQNRSPDFIVDLVPVDTKSDPATAVSAVQTVVADPTMIAFIAFYHSSTALSSKPVVQEAKIPTLIYSASNPDVTVNAPYYFRLVPTDDNQAVVLADYAKQLDAKTLGILYYADEYGKGLAEGIKARVAQTGVTVVGEQSYDATTSDFRPALAVIRSKKPDVIVICGFVEKSIAILNQAAEQGVKAKFLAGDGTFNEEQLVQGAGANAEGVYVASPYVFDEINPKNKAFLDAYWKAYDKAGEHHKPASWSAFAYDAAGILNRAFHAGHRDRASIHEYLRGMNTPEKGFDGITGLTYFNPQGNAVGRQFRLALVQGGRFVAVAPK